MTVRYFAVWALIFGLAAWGVATRAPQDPQDAAELQEIRNLGKAFYETPGLAQQAVAQLKLAAQRNPRSAQDRLNYGLALLRAGSGEEGMAEIAAAQKLDRTLPHTYFNLGIEYKKAGEAEKAIAELLQMERLVPDEAKTQYNLGALYKQIGDTRRAIEKFERTAELDPSLAAPRFQLFGIYRRTDRGRADSELAKFKELKAAQEGAAVGEDVDWSFYSELYDPSPANGAAAEPAPFVFGSADLGALNEKPLGALTFDFNGDLRADALVWSAGAALALRGGADLPQAADLGLAGAAYYAAGDFDNDGLADLCRVDAQGAAVLVSQEGRSFRTAFNQAGRFAACLFHDYDHDSDLDLFALGEDKRLLQNNGDGTLADVSSIFPFGSGTARAAAAVELFEDNGNDLVVVYGDRVSVHQDRKLGLYGEARDVAGVRVPSGAVSLTVVDADHDGYLDVAPASADGAQLLLNAAGALRAGPKLPRVTAWADFQSRGRTDGLTPESFLVNGGRGAFTPAEAAPEHVLAVSGDFNGDGKPDLIGAGAGGAVRFHANRTAAGYKGITVRLEGVKSPKLARGARVEIKAGLGYAKQVYRGLPLRFGLGAAETFDTIRVTWPNGLIQNEQEAQAGGSIDIKEAPRLSGSCPMIYTWNGREFEYISEVLGVAPLGAGLARGVYFPVDHDEYVFIRGGQLAARGGMLEARLTEELRETAYIDQIRLIAVDHPATAAIVSNEKAKGPPFPEFKLYGVYAKRHPAAATDHRGRDVLDLLTSSDRRYPLFERDFRNIAEPHALTLDFAGADPNDTVLFLEGWVDWPAASAIVASSQSAGAAIQPPYLQVRDAGGAWVTAIADMGLPAGRPRTLAVDLSGKFRSASREIRIVTNMCVYWDEAYVAAGSKRPETRLTTLAPAAAELRFHGFARNFAHPQRAQPERFVYAETTAAGMWNPTPGLYTRFGDVGELLDAVDDRFVVMGAGDEIALGFAAASLPPLPRGWSRDYLLFVDGWAKENEANTAFGDSVEPLPFHAMSGYPYGPDESFPDTPEHRRYLQEYNSRPAMRLIRPLVARGDRNGR